MNGRKGKGKNDRREKMEEKKMEGEKTCFHCNSFFPEMGTSEYGACLEEKEFEPFVEEIMENGSFDCCWELYLEKRIPLDHPICSQFSPAQFYEVGDPDEFLAETLWDFIQGASMEEVLKELYSSDGEKAEKALKTLIKYARGQNEEAFCALRDYYQELPEAKSLGQVHARVEIVRVLKDKMDKETVQALLAELKRTPSNNTSRQLYTLILDELERAPLELIYEPLTQLLEEREYSYRMKKKIERILEGPQDYFPGFF